jgi:cobalt-zinc-cadmium efflux system outer membrane protein
MNRHAHFPAKLLVLGVACLPGLRLQGQALTSPVGHLSRQQAVQEALAHNPAITVAREQVAEAKAGIAIATAIPDPSLVTELDQERNFLNPGSSSEQDIGVQFTVPYPFRTHLNGRIARGGWQVAQLALTQLKQQIASQTAQAYDAVQVAVRHRDDLTESKKISEQFLEKTQTRYQAGTVPKLDTIKAKVDLAKAENDLIANQKTIAISRSGLNHLLGRSLAVTLEEMDPLDVPGRVPDLPVLEQLAAASRPELRSITAQRKAAHDSATLAKQYWAPDLNLTLWRSDIVGLPDSYRFDGGITFPLFFWQHEKGQVSQAEHHEKELKAAEGDLFSQVMLDVDNSYATATIAWEQAIFLRDQLLPEAHAAFDTTFTSYSLGGASALDLLDAKSTLLAAESEYTDALGAVNDAEADLERATGAPLPPVTAGTSHEK